MAIDILPDKFNVAAEAELDLVHVSLVSRQLFSLLEKPEGPIAAYFTGEFVAPVRQSTDDRLGSWREFSGWARRQRGRAGRFRMYDPARPGPGYDLTVSPVRSKWSDDAYWSDGSGWVTGFLPPRIVAAEPARYGANSVVVSYGADFASILRIAQMGDRIEFLPNGMHAQHPHYYEIVNPANTNLQGKARIYFEPGLRASVRRGDGIAIRFARALVRFASANEARIRVKPPLLGDSKFAVVEALDT